VPDKDWRLTVEFTDPADGRLFDSTLCIRDHTDAGGPLSAATVVDDLHTWLADPFYSCAPALLQLQRMIVTELGTDEPSRAENDTTHVGTLAAGTGVLPHGCCPRISGQTNLATRRGRGRFHTPWPGYSSYLSSPDQWSTSGSLWTNLTTLMNDLLAGHDVTHDLIGHHYSWRIWSRLDNTSRDVTSAQVRRQPSYLRTRMTTP